MKSAKCLSQEFNFFSEIYFKRFKALKNNKLFNFFDFQSTIYEKSLNHHQNIQGAYGHAERWLLSFGWSPSSSITLQELLF